MNWDLIRRTAAQLSPTAWLRQGCVRGGQLEPGPGLPSPPPPGRAAGPGPLLPAVLCACGLEHSHPLGLWPSAGTQVGGPPSAP